MSNRIVFIDSHIANYQSLITQLPEDTEAVLLDMQRDGIEQILAALQGKMNLDAIDIISHGSPGTITLGSSVLNNDNLDDYTEQLTQIGQHLKDGGDFLLYGCEVAKGKSGQTFIEQLSLMIGVDVAASTNLTGAKELGGDWILEAQIGSIQTRAMELSYDGLLTTYSGDSGNNTLTGSTGDDTFTGDGGDDTLLGGEGNDVAIFFGNEADYEFSFGSSGSVILRDTNTSDGDEGTDITTGIETFRFANGDIQRQNTDEFRVNTYTLSDQSNPSITALTNGGFVVSWQSYGQDGDGSGIYAQRYDTNGVAQGSEFRVNTYTLSDQLNPAITALTDGGFVVSWWVDGSDPDIYAQRYDTNGVAQGSEFRVNTYTPSIQSRPSITALTDGGFVVCWVSLWEGIYAQRYDANGMAQGSEFRVNTNTFGYPSDPSITALTDGGFVVSWVSAVKSDIGYSYIGDSIYAQRYDANGVAQGGEFRVSTFLNGAYPSDPSITALIDGGFVVSWESFNGAFMGIYAQRYDANGIAQGSEFWVNTNFSINSHHSSITALTNGGFVVSWGSGGEGIYAQCYDTNGVAQGSIFRVNTSTLSDQSSPSITALTDGGFVVSWVSYGQDGDGSGIYAQRYDAEGNTVGNLTLTGSANNDDINVAVTTTEPVTLLGLAGMDDLQGGGGNDTLDGGVDNDTLHGGAGNDNLDGGLGTDTADYFDEPYDSYKITKEDEYGALLPTGEVRIIDLVNGYEDRLVNMEWAQFADGVRVPLNGELADELFKAEGRLDGDEGIKDTDTGILEAGKIKVMADFSKAAYDLQSWESRRINDFKRYSDEAVSNLVELGWEPLDLTPSLKSPDWHLYFDIDGIPHIINTTNQMLDGFYTNYNAAAFVARSADAIVISFRGTNDNEQKLSPDLQDDFIGMSAHYDLLRPLVEAVDSYIAAEGIKKVYVTGHSLGGAIATKYMDDHINGSSGANYEAITFAAPSYAKDLGSENDSRITHFEINGDPVPDTPGSHPGRTIHFGGNKITDTSLENHSMDYYRQIVDSVDSTGWDRILNEPGDQHVYIGGRKFTTYDGEDVFIVDGRRSGTNSIVSLADAGNDVLTDPLLTDFDIYYGGRGDDALTGGSDNELMLGGSGNDVLKGGDGIDRLLGDIGNDSLYDDLSGVDKLYGGLGDDIYHLSAAFPSSSYDPIIENVNEGNDSVESFVSYTLGANIENLTLRSGARKDPINATGNELANILTGSQYSNILKGLDNNDTLIGNGGDDILLGGQGVDQLNGGRDKDIFKYESISESGIGAGSRDVIQDFSFRDKIDLSAIDANVGTGNNDAFTWEGTVAFTHVAGELHYFSNSGSTIVEGDVNADGLADFQIELSGVLTLGINDFIV